jgi:hypothetical protein
MKIKFTQRLNSIEWGKLSLELIVVFLGVTAGFLLNNWRTNAVDKEVEISYIESYRNDLKNNVENIEEAIKSDSIWLLRAITLLKLVKNNELSTDSALIATQIISIINRVSLNESTYENLSNGGSLRTIKNFKLRESMVQYHIKLEETDQFNDLFVDNFRQFILPNVLSELSLINSKFFNKNGPDINQLSNSLTLYFALIQQRNVLYKDLLNRSKILFNDVNSYANTF